MTSGYPSKAFQPPTHAGVAVPFLDIDKIIGDREIKIIICCGSGGVGKTTTSAAIALRAAEAGRKVVVLDHRPGPSASPIPGRRRAGQHSTAGAQ